MEQTLPLRKAGTAATLCAALAAAACATGERLAPAPSAAVTPAAAMAMRSNGYEAPDVAKAGPSAAPGAPARVVPASYQAQRAPRGAASEGARAEAEMSPYFTPEAADAPEALPAVPAPTPQARRRAARAPLPDLAAIVVTDERAPAPKPGSEPTPGPAPEPVRTAQAFEGETRSVLPERTSQRPAPRPAGRAPAAPAPRPAAPARAAGTGQGGQRGQAALHLASYRQASQAEAGWAVLTRDHGGVLAGLSPARTTVELPGRGAFVRLLAGPLPDGDARTACAALEVQGAYCAVVRWPGES